MIDAAPMKLTAFEFLGVDGVPAARVEVLVHEAWTTQALKSPVRGQARRQL
jgi:hypothetical protein